MRLFCLLAGHDYQDGRCRKCGVWHREHDWKQVSGKCAMRCSVCGKAMAIDHTWKQIGCVSKCSVCGGEKDSHSWENHRCNVCGIYDQAVHNLFNASYVNTTSDEQIKKLLNSLSQETLTELAIRAKSPYVCHAAKDRVLDPALLARIADESDNEFIVKELKKKFICTHCGAVIDAPSLAQCKCQSCGAEAHDFLEAEETKVDGRDFSFGTRYQKCKRCGKETEHKEFSHHSDE